MYAPEGMPKGASRTNEGGDRDAGRDHSRGGVNMYLTGSDLAKANLGREAVVVGDADHFCVYGAEKWAEKQAELEVDLDALLDDED